MPGEKDLFPPKGGETDLFSILIPKGKVPHTGTDRYDLLLSHGLTSFCSVHDVKSVVENRRRLVGA
jgi:hypothetical protein